MVYHNVDIGGVTVHLCDPDIHDVTVHLCGKSWLCGATESTPAYTASANPKSMNHCKVYLCRTCKRLFWKDHLKLEPLDSRLDVHESCKRYPQLEEIKVKALLAPVLGENCCIYPKQKEENRPRNWYHTARSLVPPVTRYNPLY